MADKQTHGSVEAYSGNQLLVGLRSFLDGLGWLRRHPLCMMLLALPTAGGIGLLMVLSIAVWNRRDDIFSQLLFQEPTAWWGAMALVGAKVALTLAVFILVAIVAVCAVSILAAPIYEYVSLKVEGELIGRKPPEQSVWSSIRLIGQEVRKVFFIVTLSILLLLIPGVNVISTLVTAFLIGWDFYDYPLARRGWTFSQRFRRVREDGWAVLGLGLWLVVPFAQVVIYPLAVVGGTMLAVRGMQRRGEESIASKLSA